MKPSYYLGLKLFIVAIIFLLLASCKEDSKGKKGQKELKAFEAPAFDVNNTWSHIENQLAFGHRVPGTAEHKACKDYLVNALKSCTDQVLVQEFKASFLTVTNADAYNIVAQFNPSAAKRILIGAHWDSRLIAEKDPNPSMKSKPILGADDGASGTATVLELARILKSKPLQNIGVDLILFDAEDQGSGSVESWCLGSQYWGKNPVPANYMADYGVLLDMIGAKGAQFGREEISTVNAKSYQDKIWGLAKFLGHTALFTDVNTGQITDDHYYVMAYRGFPMVDIINRPLKTESGFGDYHHTHNDNIEILDKNVISAVGQVMTQLIYREDQGKI